VGRTNTLRPHFSCLLYDFQSLWLEALFRPVRAGIFLDSARLVLDQAARLDLEPSRVHFRVMEVLAKATGKGENPEGKIKGELLPTSFGIRIRLLGEPVRDSESDKPLRGEYELALGGSFEFPDGWRTYEGVRWSHFPDGLADERAQREVMLVSHIVTRVGEPLHAVDDSALAALGNTLIRFLQQRDEKIFDTEAMRSFEECWEALIRPCPQTGIFQKTSLIYTCISHTYNMSIS
jgi:hypothetical protein